jgi:hypothetical protein
VPIDFIYDLVGILAGMGGMLAVLRRKSEDKFRQVVALERNTEATERLSTVVEKMADKMETQDKRLDKIEYKLWGV